MKQQASGFVLATMIVLSTVLLLIGVTVLQTIVSINLTYNDSYQNQVAIQAAEAGVAVANACVAANGNDRSWGTSAPNLLTPNSNCAGTANAGTKSSYILNTPTMRSYFSVGDLTVRIDGALIIKSTGTAERLNGSGTVIGTNKTVTVNQMVTWNSAFTGSVTSSGYNRTCGIISNAAYCWGTNDYGQLGNGTVIDSAKPTKVAQDSPGLRGLIVTNIASGMFHNCVLAAGEVYCWGNNYYGQLGNGNTTNQSSPVKVNGGWTAGSVTGIGTSSYSSCAIAKNAGTDRVYCWGRNNSGQLGNSSTTNSNSPVLVSGLSGVTPTKLATSGAGTETSCVIASGAAYCWGKNTRGQLGLGGGNVTDSTSAVPVLATSGPLQGKTVTAISIDGGWNNVQSGSANPTGTPTNGHVCAVADAKAYCWGSNAYGDLGMGSVNSWYTTPTAVVATSMTGTVTDIVAGTIHSCAIANSEVWCWGSNSVGQLGDNSYPGTSQRSSPGKVAQDANGVFQVQPVTQLGGGFNRGCGVAATKTYCWGNNSTGQIGDGTNNNVRGRPVLSSFLNPKAPVFIY